MLSRDPVNAHLPSGVRAIEYIVPVCPERTRGLLSGFERSQKRAVLSQDPVKAHLPSGVRATEYIAPVCPERTEDYFQDLKDPRGVQCDLEIQLRPTYHLVSELLSLSSRYALKGHED